ncbi:uncharacterized protein LOC126592023 [Malus sylvestris]|uniref:uncharacterized protein LOC126592023 n=1 Tax=Malus sylvestris TaxID=3752 RepID=UPI0021AC2918|nr:uncharacterized protein LOC126592023 [Malus sylvestris]XP_050113732.1 uncharacterized protein LOC126592023 [Malus sylvestris]
MDHYCNPFSTDELQIMSRYEESSKHSGIGYSFTGDSPENPEDEAKIDSENEIDVEGDSENDGEESEAEDEKSWPNRLQALPLLLLIKNHNKLQSNLKVLIHKSLPLCVYKVQGLHKLKGLLNLQRISVQKEKER